MELDTLNRALALSQKMLVYARESSWDRVGQIERKRQVLYERMKQGPVGAVEKAGVEKVQAIVSIDREIVRLRCREYKNFPERKWLNCADRA